jgi:hypothetical protein
VSALALAEILAGRWADAIAAASAGLDSGRAHGQHLEDARLLAHLAQARLENGDPAGARRAADEAVDVARRQGARIPECYALLVRARVLRRTEQAAAKDRIAADVECGLALVEDVGARAFEPALREELARIDGDESKLREALGLYRAIGAAGHAERPERELARSCGSPGRPPPVTPA